MRFPHAQLLFYFEKGSATAIVWSGSTLLQPPLLQIVYIQLCQPCKIGVARIDAEEQPQLQLSIIYSLSSVIFFYHKPSSFIAKTDDDDDNSEELEIGDLDLWPCDLELSSRVLCRVA